LDTLAEIEGGRFGIETMITQSMHQIHERLGALERRLWQVTYNGQTDGPLQVWKDVKPS
jgi:hypothetical protein